MSDASVIIPVGAAIQDEFTDKTDKCSKPHNGKPITKIEVSPNDKYLITYSEDDRSIVGWNVEPTKGYSWMNGTDTDDGRLEPDTTVKINVKYKNLYQICVSDDKKLVCIYIYGDRNYLSK